MDSRKSSALDNFDSLTSRWFERVLGKPTVVQEEAWPAIAKGGHTLVSAPTGTGKTLSAFLVFLDKLMSQSRAGTLKPELQLIYISPLKSLAGDIRENLHRPMNGIFEEERKEHASTTSTPFDLKVAIRTGDTTQSERRSMIKKPPHILITTPESLFLMLTSVSGQKMLHTAKAIIIDELHAMIDTKRGAHLMLSIARLDQLCQNPLQRIGLSATIEPLELAARYLSPDQVTIIAPKMHKEVDLMVTNPRGGQLFVRKDSIWHEIARTVFELCEKTRSVIVFVDGRAYAEKIAYFVNQIGGEGFARTHHGSLSKEQRFEVERALREGRLRLLCATSSMELGIDVGDIDQVFQIGCPRSISSTLQRLGRAGHNPGRTSIMHIFPRTPVEGLYCGMTIEVVRNGGIELSHPPMLCLDVLAQHLVSMATGDGYSLDKVMEILPRAYPFTTVTKEDVKDVLCMLAGDFEHEQNIPVRPRLLYDRIHERVEGDTYSRMLAVSAAGTIPDKGLFTVKTANGVKLGEVDEEFVFEARVGDKFLLGSFSWQINNIQKDTVIVTQSTMYGARPPFYKAEIVGRKLQTGIAFGKILRRLTLAHENETLFEELSNLGMDEPSALSAQDFIKRQMEATAVLPDDKTIIIEHFHDDTGSHQMMVHSVFGRQINAPLAILAREAAKLTIKTNINCYDDDDGFLLFPYGEFDIPSGLLKTISPKTARAILEAALPATPLFNMTFRYNAGHALMMGVRKMGRQPLWIQRLRGAQMLDSLIGFQNHPLIRETKRECLEDYWDLKGLEFVLEQIQTGVIKIRELYMEEPSPMSMPLRHQTEANEMYNYSPTPMGVNIAAEEALKQTQMIAPSKEQLDLVSERRRLPEDEKQLHSLLMIEGDLIAGELEVPIEWLELLAHREQVKYIEPGLWIAAEHMDKYSAAFDQADEAARLQLILRLLRFRGAQTPELISERYLWNEQEVLRLLRQLSEQESVVESEGLYYHSELYDRARRETIKDRRRQVNTVPRSSYAAIIANRVRMIAPPNEQLENALKDLCDLPLNPSVLESTILPARVRGYRSELFDTVLSQGNINWRFTQEKEIILHRYEDIDWEVDRTDISETLSGQSKIIYDILLQRGASFMQRLSGFLDGTSPYEILMELAENGLVNADSYFPVRQWINRENVKNESVRQRVLVRSKALTSGRWEVTRPLKQMTAEQLLERNFDRAVILCRETIHGMSWSQALETLRVWEYTGRARRGYFVEGLSGIQFIKNKEYHGVIRKLEQPEEELIWLSAIDPAQVYGKSLPHMTDRSFLCVIGTAVALYAGVPIAVFERQGKILRIFETGGSSSDRLLSQTMEQFVSDFNGHRLYGTQNRIVVKQYPPEAGIILAKVGFIREMQDYVLYRKN